MSASNVLAIHPLVVRIFESKPKMSDPLMVPEKISPESFHQVYLWMPVGEEEESGDRHSCKNSPSGNKEYFFHGKRLKNVNHMALWPWRNNLGITKIGRLHPLKRHQLYPSRGSPDTRVSDITTTYLKLNAMDNLSFIEYSSLNLRLKKGCCSSHHGGTITALTQLF